MSSMNLCRTKITDTCVIKRAKHCKYLSSVHLEECSNVTDRGITKLAEHVRDLYLANLSCCDATGQGITGRLSIART